MKKNLILLTFMLVFSALATSELNAQTDGFFTNVIGQREESPNGLTFGNFYGFNNEEGLTFDDFMNNENVPVGNGMFLMATSGLFYLITKRRKENK